MNIDISDLAEKYAGLNFEDEDIEIDLPDEFWDRVDLEYERRRDGWYDE